MSPSVEKMQRQGRGFDPRQEQFELFRKKLSKKLEFPLHFLEYY
jgi:hypothetical protein